MSLRGDKPLAPSLLRKRRSIARKPTSRLPDGSSSRGYAVRGPCDARPSGLNSGVVPVFSSFDRDWIFRPGGLIGRAGRNVRIDGGKRGRRRLRSDYVSVRDSVSDLRALLRPPTSSERADLLELPSPSPSSAASPAVVHQYVPRPPTEPAPTGSGSLPALALSRRAAATAASHGLRRVSDWLRAREDERLPPPVKALRVVVVQDTGSTKPLRSPVALASVFEDDPSPPAAMAEVSPRLPKQPLPPQAGVCPPVGGTTG
eukprot:Hpha_TRINITY_DN5952_c0_g1::TRINITY_DN5952_c0_g1_i2::g.147181::m.147181